MNSTYAQKSSTVQKVADSKAASIIDSSSQNESLQRKADMTNNAAQRAEAPRPNNTGMPDNLKSGIESLSGFSMDNVRVHYNSSKPATVQALAYTQGTDIHVAPGQEKCLPHEAWHVAQQMAGRVSPTTNINGMPVNDNAALEHEADVMGEKAVTQRMIDYRVFKCRNVEDSITQRVFCFRLSPERKNLLLQYAYAECHNGEKFSESLKKMNLKNGNETFYSNVDNFNENETRTEIYKFVKFFNDVIPIYQSSKKIRLTSHEDVQHQVAQDYLLANVNGGNSHRMLVGRIHHQFDKYKYADDERVESSREVTLQKLKQLDNVRIYRSMKLDDFYSANLSGHGGLFGMALHYDGDEQYVIIEISIEKVKAWPILGNQGSQTTSKTDILGLQEDALGRKTEKVCLLPDSVTGSTSLTETGSFAKKEHRGLFSFNFSGSTSKLMTTLNPKMRVVYCNTDDFPDALLFHSFYYNDWLEFANKVMTRWGRK